jgi:HD-like signal output (HDOD) protein
MQNRGPEAFPEAIFASISSAIVKALGLRLMIALIVGLKASIREMKEDTTSRQDEIPEKRAL